MNDDNIQSEELWALVSEAYTVHFMMFGCGLDPGDVFVGVDRVEGTPTDEPYVYVLAQKNGKKFLFWIAPVSRPKGEAAFREEWSRFSHRQAKADRGELDWMVVTSVAYLQFPALREGLIRKGLVDASAGTGMLEAWKEAFEPPLARQALN